MWLLEESIKKKIETAEASGYSPTAEQLCDFEARSDVESRAGRMSPEAGKIFVSGVLTKTPDFFAMIFGGGNTVYGDIIEALERADADDNVTDITMYFDTVGGTIRGLFPVLNAMNKTKKPITAVVSEQALSAGYAIASQADRIVAEHSASMVGSVGIMTTMNIDDHEVNITSTDAPEKSPDARTEEGKAVVVKQLDAIHNLFVERIAQGRNSSPEKVNAEFGRGAVVLADDALKAGMIDAIGFTKEEQTQTGNNMEAQNKMDLNQLKAEHLDLFNQVKAEGIAEGQASERARVIEHLDMIDMSGDSALAFKAIKNGDALTVAMTKEHVASAVKNQQIAGRAEEEQLVAGNANIDVASAGSADAFDEAVAMELGGCQ